MPRMQISVRIYAIHNATEVKIVLGPPECDFESIGRMLKECNTGMAKECRHASDTHKGFSLAALNYNLGDDPERKSSALHMIGQGLRDARHVC